MTFRIGEGSLFEYILALVFVALVFVLFLGTFVVLGTVFYQNIKDRWPHYEKATKAKILRNVIIWPSVFVVLVVISMMELK